MGAYEVYVCLRLRHDQPPPMHRSGVPVLTRSYPLNKAESEVDMTLWSRRASQILLFASVLLVIHVCEALHKQHLRANGGDKRAPGFEHKQRALHKACNASISEYMQIVGKLVSEEKRCEICTHVYDCGFCQDTATCMPGEHQGPMRFDSKEAKNCSKWHFSPVSCMQGESASKGWVEPELKAVENVKGQDAEEKIGKQVAGGRLAGRHRGQHNAPGRRSSPCGPWHPLLCYARTPWRRR